VLTSTSAAPPNSSRFSETYTARSRFTWNGDCRLASTPIDASSHVSRTPSRTPTPAAATLYRTLRVR
jgi:hypothetical protein